MSPLEKEVRNGPLSVKDPILEMVAILSMCWTNLIAGTTMGEVYQFKPESKSTFMFLGKYGTPSLLIDDS